MSHTVNVMLAGIKLRTAKRQLEGLNVSLKPSAKVSTGFLVEVGNK
jgi:hypothetical protein